MTQKKSKNDEAWERIFCEFDVIENIEKNGVFNIKSEVINRFRESRLMAKFDYLSSLPKIFKDNKLSILPISRSEYSIGRFSTHYEIEYQPERQIEYFDLPNLESLNTSSIDSESISLLLAYNSGLISRVFDGQEFSLTLMGRMSTGEFNFRIEDSQGKDGYEIRVKNSQCEIDAGFEGNESLVIVEVKNHAVDDFLIRQLYYPYRCWKNKVHKHVIPVFMTFSEDIFSFFVYEFANPEVYNSLFLKYEKHYVAGSELIESDDVLSVLNQTYVKSEPVGVPFPQADSFERVFDLLQLLSKGEQAKNEITDYYQFDPRQTDYYTNAGRYLGLIDKRTFNGVLYYFLTEDGLKIMKLYRKKKVLALIGLILEHCAFREVFKASILTGDFMENKQISGVMEDCGLQEMKETTKLRRATTVRRWIHWIHRQY
jgi:hypothetical protein